MLANPYPFQHDIITKMHEALRNPRYLYFGVNEFAIGTDRIAQQTEWTEIDRASVRNLGQMFTQQVVGYMRAGISRHKNNTITDISAICFEDYSVLYACDLIRFFNMLFTEYKCQKINWHVCASSPHAKSYNKLCERWGGRKFGPFKKEFKLRNGDMDDGFIYEITLEEFENKMKESKQKGKYEH